MKLATVADGTRDGRLVIVSTDLSRAVCAEGIAATMQEALDRWTEVEGALTARADELERGAVAAAFDFAAHAALAPLPRA